MSKHTPLPWQLDIESESVEGCRDIIGCGGVIATTHGLSDDAEDLANARLLTASPYLLAALHDALEFIEDNMDVVDGPYGEPKPNRAMTLAGQISDVIAKTTRSSSDAHETEATE